MGESGEPERTRRWRLWVTVTAFVVLAAAAGIGAGWTWRAIALEAVATADRQVVAASTALAEVTDQRGSAIDKARSAISSLSVFTEHPRPDYLPEAAATALTAAHAELQAKSTGLTFAPFDAPHASADGGDLLPWTVLADVQHSEQVIRQEQADRKSKAADLASLNAAQKKLAQAAATVYTALAAHGEQVLTADTAASYASKVELRHAIDGGKDGVISAQFGGSGLLQLVSTIDGVNVAEAAGEAAKQDPAYPIRAQIEDYARSIAHGVTLDFEWHKAVSGLSDGWYSGTTQYRYEDGGWATIDLNFTIQEGWTDGDIDAKAVVTHEVGHAQVVRPECKALFDGPVFNENDEMWATAWAISMGFDVGGSGIEAYGRPSDEQIAVAGQCR
ncbi:hypothetical protein [Leifsonia sp. LS-T14]|uniref:hypothetical protein n=1 Tax=unclassified Leifsonia TaxID=2663824 RepID=UPI0035A693E4